MYCVNITVHRDTREVAEEVGNRWNEAGHIYAAASDHLRLPAPARVVVCMSRPTTTVCSVRGTRFRDSFCDAGERLDTTTGQLN